jgi:hypothetical protein
MKDSEKVRFDLRQIMRALDWWNEGGWKTSNAVGAIIQQKAQKLLGIHADMSALRTEAGSQLEKNKVEEEMKAQQVVREPTLSMMPGSWSIPFAFTGITLKKTRREELEEMTTGQIRDLFREKQAKEIKADRIRYILESEKEYK